MLVINNESQRELILDALMTVPQDKGIHETSIPPVERLNRGSVTMSHGLTRLSSWY